MNTTINKIITFLAITLLIFGGYVYFSYTDKSEALTSSLTSSNDSASVSSNNNSGDSSGQIARDTAFLNTLTTLNVIKIDTSLFTNVAFRALKDNEVVIEPVTPGRANPFATIGAVTNTDNQFSKVTTNPATQITTTTAVLNGTTASNATLNSSYFEYGPTNTLGKATLPAIVTLVGTFNTRILGLKPKTTYYFRAGSKIGGVVVYGDVLSFNTN